MNPARGPASPGGFVRARMFDPSPRFRWITFPLSGAAHAPARERNRATHTLRVVVVEPDADVWHAHCPALDAYGAAARGTTREIAGAASRRALAARA